MTQWVFPFTMVSQDEKHFHVKVNFVSQREVEHPVVRAFYLNAFSLRFLI